MPNNISRRWLLMLLISLLIVAAWLNPETVSTGFRETREAMFQWTFHKLFAFVLNSAV